MTIWFLVAFWVLAGLGVLSFAMGSTRPRRRPGQARTRTRGVLVVTGIVAIVFVAAIPAVALVSGAGDQARSGEGGVDLTDTQAEGRELFAGNCANCHTLAGANAVGKTGPSLDQLRPKAGLVVDAVNKGRARGMGNMPAELLQGEDVDKVASFVEAVSGR